MAGLNSWILPGNGILGGVTLNIGPSRPNDPDSDDETPWTKALREAIEKLPGGDADHPAMPVRQVRPGAIQTGPADPLARPGAALIDWLRQPPALSAMTTKSDRPQQPTMLQHEWVARHSGANIGKAIVDYYADYFDPWAKDEQGRHIAETPDWTPPNAAGKTPSVEKPWFMPIVGGIDIGSNFIGPGAGVKAATFGGRAAFAVSKAATAGAGQTDKLLNAIREGQLAKLAGEGAGGETLASRSAGLYNPPAKLPRPFVADYPQGAPADATGRLTHDIEGRPLTARYIAGRRNAGLSDVRIEPKDLFEIAQGSIGGIPEAVEARALPRGAVGAYRVKPGLDGPERSIGYLRSLPAHQVERVVGHETGHMIEELSGTIPTDRLSRELAQVYNTLNTGQERTRNLTRPKDFQYSDSEAPQELMAEAIRAYMWDPNYLKTVAPKTAARIREFVNANPRLSKVIQFNAAGGAVPFIQGSQPDVRDLDDVR